MVFNPQAPVTQVVGSGENGAVLVDLGGPITIESADINIMFPTTQDVIIIDTLGPKDLFGTESIPTGVETTVFTYLVPGSKVLVIQGFLATGTADMRFILRVDGLMRAVARISVAQPNANPHLNIKVVTGQTVALTAFHTEAANQTAEIGLFGTLTL